MKKLAYAGLLCLAAGAGLALLATPLNAKGGAGFSARVNIGPLARRGFPIVRNIGPLAGRHFAHRHHRHFYGDGWGWDYGYYPGYLGYAGPAAPDENYTPPAPPRIAEPVIRTVENSKDVCKSEPVTVPASGGGETTVNVIRC